MASIKPKHLLLSVLFLSMLAVNACSNIREPMRAEVIAETVQKNYKLVDKFVLIQTDKNSYKQGETVTITIHNNSSETISYYGYLGYESKNIQKKSNTSGTWELLETVYPYDGFHILGHLPQNETGNSEWDQTVLDVGNYPNRFAASSGTYRIKFVFWTACPYMWPVSGGCLDPCPFNVPAEDCPEHVIFSNEFHIEQVGPF